MNKGLPFLLSNKISFLHSNIFQIFPFPLKQCLVRIIHEAHNYTTTFIFVFVQFLFRLNAKGPPYQCKTQVHPGRLLLKDHQPFHIRFSCFLGLNLNILNSDISTSSILLQIIFFKLQCRYALLKL